MSKLCVLGLFLTLSAYGADVTESPELKAATDAAYAYGLAISRLPDGAEKRTETEKACREICSLQPKAQPACVTGCLREMAPSSRK